MSFLLVVIFFLLFVFPLIGIIIGLDGSSLPGAAPKLPQPAGTSNGTGSNVYTQVYGTYK